MSRSDIRPLTSLRFIAALLVFFSHYSGIPYTRTSQPLQSLFLEGNVGVTIFFVLSGFLITLHYFPLIAEGGFSTYSYFLKRAARILPLYWFMLGLALVSGELIHAPVYAPQPLANWTLMQGYFSGLATSILVPGWSITVEISFYLIAPVILRSCVPVADDLKRVGGRLLNWTIGLLVVGLVLIWLSHAAGLSDAYGFMDNFGFLTYFTLFGRGFHFCVGIFLALFYVKRRDSLWAGLHAGQWATYLFTGGMVSIGVLEILINWLGGSINAWYLNLLVAVCAGGVVLSLTCPTAISSRILSLRFPVYLGSISYALYLFQGTPLAHSLFPTLNKSPLLFYGVISLMSAFLYEAVERPARRFVLWFGGRLSNRGRFETLPYKRNT